MNRKISWGVGVALAVAAAAAGVAYHQLGFHPDFEPDRLVDYYSAVAAPRAQPVEAQVVREAVGRSAAYLRRASLPSGQFVYLVNMNPDVAVPPAYNLLRHAGAIYAIGMAHGITPDSDNLHVMRRAAGFMRECCTSQLDDGMVGIWEPAGIVHLQIPPSYKLGGAGLGLVALTGLAALDHASVREDELVGLARFGQFMQRWNGQFYAKYVPSKGGRVDPGGSLYYPGEMALGWLELYELDPDPAWFESAVQALKFLAKERAESGSAPPDHWALLATARLFEVADRAKADIPRELLFNHALQVCHAILEEGGITPMLPEMDGALVARGEVTPTATRLEGLLAARTFLPADHPITPHVDAAIHRGIDFLVRAQVKEGPYEGGLPFAITQLPSDAGGATSAFNAQSTEIRIDYVQHALSAMVQYLEWQGAGTGRP